MPSSLHVVLTGLLAVAFYAALGHSITRHVLPRALASGAAPVIGWAIFSAVTLPLLTIVGFTSSTVVASGAVCLLASAWLVTTRRRERDAASPAIPVWSYAAVGVLALGPAVALLPKQTAAGVQLADPIFDHAKIAAVDAMARQGLPPVNPVFGAFGEPGQLAYYYLWHFSAAELALPLHMMGWEAAIGLAWFTAFASLTLTMGVAVWLSKKPSAAILVVLVAAAASLRVTLSLVFGSYQLTPFMEPSTGLGGWLFQAAWVPQHLMSAACVVAAMLLLIRYAQQQSLTALVILALVVAAGFESSTYVGGITFGIAALVSAPILLAGVAPKQRLRLVAGLALAAVLAVCLSAPLIRDQAANVMARGTSHPITISPFAVLGAMVPLSVRRVLDLPAYWLLLLPIEFPAIYPAGVVALATLVVSRAASGAEKTTAMVLAAFAVTSLCVSWLLTSTLGENSDLTLRAVLPAVIILMASVAAGVAAASRRRAIIAAFALGGLVLSLPDSARMLASYIEGTVRPGGELFAQSPELWAAVRHYAPPSARVANNPLYLHDLTPWPVNISWALLANRSSCFAGREMALAFAPLSPERREAIDRQFIRIFTGEATPDDVGAMANNYGCDVVVVVPQDGAWTKDPFAANPLYRLAESRDGRWRIYVRAVTAR
ncbi:MAG TPA: hypothetical protein VHU22_04770 [Xanthobacteraceae bacterium]|jgi:hypothetical protein|nr:hypothetical protein [Xanthobacteraceae bacterium]